MLLPILLLASILSTSQFGFNRNKGHFHHGHPMPEQLPSFLRNLSIEAQSEFFEIVRDRKTPRREIKARAEKWAEKQGVVVHKIVTDDSLSRDQMIEKLRALEVDPAVGRSLRGVMFAVAHPHIHGKHHPGHRNSSHPTAYEGLGPLAAVLGHGGKGDGMLPIGTEDHEHHDFA
ncbi:hypothetical protein ANCCAN_15251 [Ancylostoma caninum]|uniref:SXP/RAL-2 family protein Ani s 5-like cation-binding domain-containing protein n=1 Tax=Ancylostoma caninum TaxID=29170 RepID=A0A368G307_ANCCA|nr:hypothetical protein ANCCAN_15251 [Ancylostoma caninum]